MGNQEEQSAVKKGAYAALGLPSQIANKLREGMSNISETSAETRAKLMAQLEQSVDEWKAEGERVTKSVIGKVKDSTEAATGKAKEVMETAKDKVKTGTEAAESAAATVARPAVPIETIDGVGPSYASVLEKAGVGSTLALVERCDSSEAIGRLAEQTSISTALIENWVSNADLTRVSGVGFETMKTLNRFGVGTVKSLAGQDPAAMREKMAGDARFRGSVPSEKTLLGWIDSAKAL